MEFKSLNDTGERLPEIGIGTWKMGVDPESEKAAIKRALALGMRFVDTAEMYGSEKIVGSAIKNEGKVFVATKVSPSHFSHDGVVRACNESLDALGIDRIDLYQLHWPNHRIPIRETMSAMEELADSGKIRHIGVSNFDIKELAEAQSAMKRHDIVSNQVEYSIIMRDIENGLLDFCTENKVTIIAYSPLGTGALYSPRFRDVLSALEGIGSKHGKTATQVALNWTISKRNVVAIPKSGNVRHVEEIAGSSGWRLSKSEMRELDAVKERKGALAGGLMAPVLKNTSIWATAMQAFNKRRASRNQKSSTTRSSKK